ncbi:hypothetical protein BAUCODRAFT_405492 [Baudoinia panamericana UAMH 10762]|uniref:DUF7907 domain-containing protein n=1 Tax=Baudoinia panamericana (strain UAMH 10762) TaxID=717646 RepID=M2LTH0_BAUPA|nr:uncharacterized protein BAUCODRAFT_405492 [Baudoinia panamericana UAMH 10762]EMC97832.1 hypothetical protein BAUCODRAFT_405492 [Baudoinia panamericana UAMH 10762]
MHHTNSILATFIVLFRIALTQTYNIQTPPFFLYLVSDDADFQGKFLSPCHIGAGESTLCYNSASNISSDPSLYTYALNTTADEPTDPSAEIYGAPGVLTWNLPYNGNQFESIPMSFVPARSVSGVALLDFEPGPASGGTQIAFDDNNFMNVQTVFANATETGLVYGSSNEAYYRWYMCNATEPPGDYNYWTLSWDLSSATPADSSCCAVQVWRMFMPQAGQPNP